MKRYKLGERRASRISFPALIGGINMNNNALTVGDNQLSDALNVIAEDGTIKTRPGFVSSKALVAVLQSTAKNVKEVGTTESGTVFSVCGENALSYFRCSIEAEMQLLGEINIDSGIKNEWSVIWEDAIYSFITTGDGGYIIYKNYKEINKKEIYAPLLFTNCKPTGKLVPDINGDSIEGYNLIGDRYRIQWTAFNSQVEQGNPHFAYYSLPEIAKVGSTVEVEIMNDDGSIDNHLITIGESWSYSELKNGVKVGIVGRMMQLVGENNNPLLACSTYPLNEDGTEKSAEEKKAYFKNNIRNGITITAAYEGTAGERENIFSATRAQWFGGGRGLASGTRLFISGMSGAFKNVLQWSGLLNPLYFPTDCNVEIGNSNTSITALAKQENMLVIFKEDEIYYTTYNTGDIEDISNAALDLSVSTAVFPITQIPAAIGCDCPDTIRLCNNRLVWASSNGKVYVLVNSSQYNERNIYEISSAVKSILNTYTEDELKKATAAEYGGYYVLCFGDSMLLMDYTSYGYRYIYSYKNEQAVEEKLPWFYLSIPTRFCRVVNYKDKLLGISVDDKILSVYYAFANANKDVVASYSEDAFSFEEKKIKSMLQTKFFDFGYPEYYKKITTMCCELGDTEGDGVFASFVTERCQTIFRTRDVKYDDTAIYVKLAGETAGESEELLELPIGYSEAELNISTDGKGMNPINIRARFERRNAPENMNMVRVFPRLNFIRKFAVKFECDGGFSLGSLSLEYYVKGRVK